MNVTLDTLIKSALHNNPILKAGELQTKIKSVEIDKAKSIMLPNVTAKTSYQLTNQYKSGNDFNTINGGINAIQQIYSFGKNKALIEESKFIGQAESSRYHSQQQDFVLQVKQLYYMYLKSNDLLDVAKRNKEQSELLLAIAKEKTALGIEKHSDVLTAESDLANATFTVTGYENSLGKVKNELIQLTGLSNATISNLRGNLFLNNSSVLKINTDSLVQIAIQNYPDINVLDNLLSSKECRIKSVKAEKLPEINAETGYNFNYNPTFNDANYWNLGISIRWNIFDRNQKKYQLQIEEFQKQSLYSQKANLLSIIKKEIDNQLLSVKESLSQIEVSKILQKSTSENLRLVEEEYKNGVSSMLELTAALSADFNAKEKNINAWAVFQDASAQVERILGLIYAKYY
jgi:outer membrane protein TolC